MVNGYAVSGNYISFENTQSETFTVVATDSRGYTNTLELKPTIVQYIPLSITVKFDRLSATSSEVKVKYSGNYYNGNFGSIDNELTIRWAYKIKEASEWIDGGTLTPTIENNTFSGETSLGKIFNYKTAYDFILYVSDKLSTVNPQETVKKGETIFDYGIDADGNNYLNVNGDIYKNNKNIFSLIYPVGSIYMSANSTNPKNLFGGTWVAWGSGRVPVGVDTAQTEFETVEKTGGEKTHTLTVDEMPLHKHGENITSPYGYEYPLVGENSEGYTKDGYVFATSAISEKNNEQVLTDSNGGGNPHNNLQPYITCYMFKRVG